MGILMRTSFLKIGVLESKSETVMPMPTPHKAREPFQARMVCLYHANFHRNTPNQRRTFIDTGESEEGNSEKEGENDEVSEYFF
jgi:hypothetical protein